jgi:hypothetical protein
MNEKGTIDRLPFDDYDAGHRSSLVFQGACWSTHCSDDVVRNLSTTSDTMEARSEDAVRNTLSARPGACFGSPLACHRRGPGWVCAFLNSAGVHEAKGSTKYCRNNRRMVFLVADFKSDIRVWRKSGLDLVCDLPGHCRSCAGLPADPDIPC